MESKGKFLVFLIQFVFLVCYAVAGKRTLVSRVVDEYFIVAPPMLTENGGIYWYIRVRF